MLIQEKLSAEDKLTKARIQLQAEKPFWSYLVMHLKFIEDKSIPTMGVDRYGNLYYNPDFVDKLTEETTKGVLCHEVMHCALEHFERGEKKNHQLFNIAGDTVINAILLADGIELPNNLDIIYPINNQVEILGVKIKNITDKTAEEIYDKLRSRIMKELKGSTISFGGYVEKEAKRDSRTKGFDKHIYDKNGEKEKGDSDAIGKDKKGVNWKKVLVDACSFARQRGTLPRGMERIVEKLLKTHIDWRGLLYKYITSQIPIDYTWSKPSKRSFSLNTYLPAVTRETIDVVVAIDTSGSISQGELTQFISEISSIVNSFKNVDLTAIVCDAEVHGVYKLRNATIDEVIKKIGKNLKGGGGTSHIPVFNWINREKPSAKFIICFTDGWTEFPKASQVNIPTLWVLAGDYRLEREKIPFGNVIELPKRD